MTNQVNMGAFFDWFLSLSQAQQELVENLSHQAIGMCVYHQRDMLVSEVLAQVMSAAKRAIADAEEWERVRAIEPDSE